MPGHFSYPRRVRINHQRAYEPVFKSGRKLVGPEYVCYVSRQPDAGVRLGVVVSRKVGGAVVRNRIKRYVREFFRLHQQLIAEDTQLVVVARVQAARFHSYELSAQALRQLLARGAVIDA